MSHRYRPRPAAPASRPRRGFATFVGVLSFFAAIGLGMALTYDIRLLGGPDLVFSKQAPAGWALFGKLIVIAPAFVTAYAFGGLTRRRDFFSTWAGLLAGGLAFHVPLLLPAHFGPAVIVCINVGQAVLALVLSRTERFAAGLRAFESNGLPPTP